MGVSMRSYSVQVPQVEISNGELLDRLSILKVKEEFLESVEQVGLVQEEIRGLEGSAEPLLQVPRIHEIYLELHEANRKMWIAMQAVYDRKGELDDALVVDVLQIIEVNKERAFKKAAIDVATDSRLKEAKSFFAGD
jgi:hypothetical protein